MVAYENRMKTSVLVLPMAVLCVSIATRAGDVVAFQSPGMIGIASAYVDEGGEPKASNSSPQLTGSPIGSGAYAYYSDPIPPPSNGFAASQFSGAYGGSSPVLSLVMVATGSGGGSAGYQCGGRASVFFSATFPGAPAVWVEGNAEFVNSSYDFGGAALDLVVDGYDSHGQSVYYGIGTSGVEGSSYIPHATSIRADVMAAGGVGQIHGDRFLQGTATAWMSEFFSTLPPGTVESFPLLPTDNRSGQGGADDGNQHPYLGANGNWYGPLLFHADQTARPRPAIVLQDSSANTFQKIILPSSISGNLYVDISGTQYGPYAAGDTIDFSSLRSPSGAVDIPSVGKLALVYVNGTDPAGVPLQIFQRGPSASFFEALIRAGDADFDGKVDFADLIAVARHYGQAAGATWRDGDFDGDGKVDFADLLALARNFGTMPTSSQLAQLDPAFRADVERAFAEVPEPSSLPPLSLGCAVLLHRRRTRRAGCRIMGRGV